MAKIESVVARTVAVPLDRPTAFSTREVTHRHYTLVRVQDAQGRSGIGFCYAGNTAGTVVTEAVRQLLRPLAVGSDTLAVRGTWEKMYRNGLLHGRAGSAMRAQSAIDIAIWDYNARAADLPLWSYLGAVTTTDVPAYASGGYYLEGKGPGDLADEMAAYIEMGFRAVKLKVGRASAAEDAARIKAVRDRVGPDVLVMLDANNAWREVDQAARALHLWEEYNPYWIEEPFGPEDTRSHVELSRRVATTVATGEILAGRWEFRDFIEAGGAVIVQPDAAVCGGITEFMRVLALAETHGVGVAPHWFHDLHAHLVATSPNGRFVEFFPGDDVLNFRKLITDQLRILDGGRLQLPHSPGLGFDFDEEAVASFAIDSWE